MVRRRDKFPAIGEVVVGTVKAVNPYSLFVMLDEYGRDGMVHVSEVARKWIRDIRDFAKEGDKVVCSVMQVDLEKGHVSLSIKRVNDNEKNRRLQTWKRDQKGEKLLEKIAKEKKITLDKAYEQIGFDLQEIFKDMLEPFEIALKDTALLERKGISKDWVSSLEKIAKENIEIKEREMQYEVSLHTYQPDGIEIIRKTLQSAEKKYGVQVRYLSTPRYLMTFKTADFKQGDKLLTQAAEEVQKVIEKSGGECSFKKVEA